MLWLNSQTTLIPSTVLRSVQIKTPSFQEIILEKLEFIQRHAQLNANQANTTARMPAKNALSFSHFAQSVHPKPARCAYQDIFKLVVLV